MLLVKTTLGLSAIHGIGLFAAEPIPKDTVIWRFLPPFDFEFDVEDSDVAILPTFALETLLKYSYQNKTTKMFVLCGDDARFMNHSETPNSLHAASSDLEGLDVAARDIAIGEEITCDYKEFDDGNTDYSAHP